MDFDAIEKLGEKYNLKVHATVGAIFIQSPKGNWMFDTIRETDIRLYHKNTRRKRNCNFEEGYHFQKSLPDIEETFRYIVQHDRTRYTKKERTERFREKMFRGIA